MTAGDLGHAAILLALILAAFQVPAAAFGALRDVPELVRSARNAAAACAMLIATAALALLYALLSRDFSIQYVIDTSSRAMPLDIVYTAMWGGQPGSLLIWTLVLSTLSAIAIWRTSTRQPDLAPYLALVLGSVQLFFVFLLAFPSSPFEPAAIPADDGRGLNPLLWDAGMRFHPPLLLSGYASYAVPFGFGVAALLSGRLGREWLAATRRWMLLAWFIQGCGLLAGAWWAYRVLGWGGYWGWDPVENAALMPWLVATAYIHSAIVQERRGMLKLWTLCLVLAAFLLAIFGTFIVRSGVLSSVHSFAESSIGPFFFGFLGLLLIGCIGLFVYRLPVLRAENRFVSITSRESGFLLNNWLLGSIAAATFWGTLFPVVSEALRGSKVAVGAPFYNAVNGPLGFALLLLMGVGPVLAWRRTPHSALWRRLRWPLACAAMASALLLALGMRQGLPLLALGSVAFAGAATILEFWWGMRARQSSTGEPPLLALYNLVARARQRYGGYLVHLAMLLFAVGVIGSSFYKQEEAVTLQPGQNLEMGRYNLVYVRSLDRPAPGRTATVAQLSAEVNGKEVALMEPGRVVHTGWESQPTSSIAVHTQLPNFEDLYILLVNVNDDGSATLRVFIEPLVSLLWISGVLFILGTAVAAWPDMRPRAAATPVLVPGGALSHA